MASSTNTGFSGLGRSSLGPAFILGGAQQGTGLGSVSGGSLPPSSLGRGRLSRSASLSASARHGSGAPYTIRSSSRTQDRAERRSAREEVLQPDEAAVRVLPVGRQEAADWAQGFTWEQHSKAVWAIWGRLQEGHYLRVQHAAQEGP